MVATEVGGVPELVEAGVTGFLVPPRDPDALAESLQRLITDPELRRRMGEAGRKKPLREFTLDRMLRETERVDGEVLFGCSTAGQGRGGWDVKQSLIGCHQRQPGVQRLWPQGSDQPDPYEEGQQVGFEWPPYG